jgi:serine protease inhibitor
MIAAYNILAQAVFRTLAQSADNIVISPLSIGVTLAMGFAAAAGETAEEMARMLKFERIAENRQLVSEGSWNGARASALPR